MVVLINDRTHIDAKDKDKDLYLERSYSYIALYIASSSEFDHFCTLVSC